MGRVAMNFSTVVYLHCMYSSNYLGPASLSAFAIGGYSHPPSVRLFGSFPRILLNTQWWNPPRVRAMRGVTTQVSNLKTSVAYITVT